MNLFGQEVIHLSVWNLCERSLNNVEKMCSPTMSARKRIVGCQTVEFDIFINSFAAA